jgi:hypothetical protein
MNSSYESEFNKTNFFMKDMITEIDTKSITTNLSNLNLGYLSSNKLLVKGSLTDTKKLGSTFSLQNEILRDTSSLGLIKIRKTDKEKLNSKIINLNEGKYQDSWIDICSSNISKIVLIKVVDQCYFEGHLHLKNNLDTEYILVKFINNKYYYMITPSIFFIKPRNEIIINIKKFFKLAPDTPLNKEKDSILMIAKKTTNKIDDLNDVKIYLKDEDIYSQDYQLFSFSLILDNGYNPIYYDKLIEDRKKNIEAFYAKTNINEIKNINTIKEHIEDMKINIREYKNKIKKIEKEFEMILEKIENQNIMNKENNKQEQINKIMVNKEEFFEVSEENKKGRTIEEINPNTLRKNVYDTFHDDNGVTIPMILFGMSLGLFLGKFIKNFFV